jgi:hypothetical protein
MVAEEFDVPVVSALAVRSRKLSNVGRSSDGWPKIYYLELLLALEGTLRHWSRLHLQSLAPTNSHWACVVGYDPFSLCMIYKEGMCPSSGDIDRLMMMMMMMIDGKPIAVWSQSISSASTVITLIAFYEIHRRKGEALSFFSVPNTNILL